MSESPNKPVSAALGQPELDPPFTWRVHPADQPMDLRARRALRMFPATTAPWVIVSGPIVAGQLRDDDVRTWPYTSDTVAGAAVIKAARQGPREGLVQPAERGDMDADAFKGGA